MNHVLLHQTVNEQWNATKTIITNFITYLREAGTSSGYPPLVTEPSSSHSKPLVGWRQSIDRAVSTTFVIPVFITVHSRPRNRIAVSGRISFTTDLNDCFLARVAP